VTIQIWPYRNWNQNANWAVSSIARNRDRKNYFLLFISLIKPTAPRTSAVAKMALPPSISGTSWTLALAWDAIRQEAIAVKQSACNLVILSSLVYRYKK